MLTVNSLLPLHRHDSRRGSPVVNFLIVWAVVLSASSFTALAITVVRSTTSISSHGANNIPSNRRAFLKTASAVVSTVPFGGNSVAFASPEESLDGQVQAKSAFIGVAKNYVSDNDESNPLDCIDWNMPLKQKPKRSMEQLADAINDGLIENEWFVTGKGRPELFTKDFAFQDPQVSLVGYENYCRSVRRLFDQSTARCEVVCCSVTSSNQITVLWRNSGKVTLGPGIELKPYLVTTTLTTIPREDGGGYLVASQVDDFDSDPIGLLLYQFPVLRPLAGPPAASIDKLKQQCDFHTCKIPN